MMRLWHQCAHVYHPEHSEGACMAIKTMSSHAWHHSPPSKQSAEIWECWLFWHTTTHHKINLYVWMSMQVHVAASRLAQATGSFPGNFTAAETHMQQAIQVHTCYLLLSKHESKASMPFVEFICRMGEIMTCSFQLLHWSAPDCILSYSAWSSANKAVTSQILKTCTPYQYMRLLYIRLYV